MGNHIGRSEKSFVTAILFSLTVLATGCGKEIASINDLDSGIISNAKEALLKPLIAEIQNRLTTIQNNDGGWDWIDTPANLEASTALPTKDANMFGGCAMGVLNGYTVTGEYLARVAVEKTVPALLAKAVSRTQLGYIADAEFLLSAFATFGGAGVREKAIQTYNAEKEYLAAVHVYNKAKPSTAQLNALTPAQIAGVTATQFAAANRKRMVDAGRNAGLRAYDWTPRIRTADALGDIAYRDAIAQIIANDYASVTVEAQWYFLGLANTIITLYPLRSVPQYALVIENAKQKLLTHQKQDGWFSATSTNGKISHGNEQDQAFILRALVLTQQRDPATFLIGAIRNKIPTPKGNYVDSAGKEAPTAEADLLSALVDAYKNL